jgi:hypothetical protein
MRPPLLGCNMMKIHRDLPVGTESVLLNQFLVALLQPKQISSQALTDCRPKPKPLLGQYGRRGDCQSQNGASMRTPIVSDFLAGSRQPVQPVLSAAWAETDVPRMLLPGLPFPRLPV